MLAKVMRGDPSAPSYIARALDQRNILETMVAEVAS